MQFIGRNNFLYITAVRTECITSMRWNGERWERWKSKYELSNRQFPVKFTITGLTDTGDNQFNCLCARPNNYGLRAGRNVNACSNNLLLYLPTFFDLVNLSTCNKSPMFVLESVCHHSVDGIAPCAALPPSCQ